MKVKVLFFGATADAVGEREVQVNFPDGANAQQAFSEIVKNFPQLNQHSLLFAVNQEYANGDENINDGDEVAVFTAVSGG